MTTDIAIRVTNLSKRYEIHDTPTGWLKQSVLPNLQKLAVTKRSPAHVFATMAIGKYE